MNSEQRVMKTVGKLVKKLWLFEDTIMNGVGREVRFLIKGLYRIMDRTKSGATMDTVRSAVRGNLRFIQPRGLMVVEEGGNALLEVVERWTMR